MDYSEQVAMLKTVISKTTGTPESEITEDTDLGSRFPNLVLTSWRWAYGLGDSYERVKVEPGTKIKDLLNFGRQYVFLS